MANNEQDTQQARRDKEIQLASIWNFRFKDAMVHKAPYTKRWQMYWDAYNGDYFKNKKNPEYKSDLVSNYIFSIVETIRPIMLDNNPKFQAMPRHPKAMPFSNDLQEALLYEWDRERMKRKLAKELITTLVIGTAVAFIPWDSEEKNVKAIFVNPFNIFPDPLATSVDDAEYIIYASYKNAVRLKRKYPDKAERLSGSQVNYSELVHDNDKNARVDNQILVLEVWTWDTESEVDEEGNERHTRNQYPNGRIITLCPELGVVLDDKPNPYKTPKTRKARFPFELIKDYDVPGKFWGEGEVAQLLSPQKHMNELNNAILDSAKATANMPWVIDKNAGISHGAITARPGLIIRKNPGTEVKREQPPSMPPYVVNAVETYKEDVEQISGVFNTLKGERATGVYTAQGILALQEAGQVRIRLKVDLMEDCLGKIAQLWLDRMGQYWKEDRWVRICKPTGDYDFKHISKDAFDYDYDVKICAGSTMPVNRGAMLDLMIRLAQTPMPDGQPLVDREAVVQYLPEEAKSAILQRMQGQHMQMAELQQAIEQLMEGLQILHGELQQVAQESNQNDEQQFTLIEEMMQTIEHISEQILQLKEEHDKIEEEREEQEKEEAIRKESYNKGYADAETLYTEDELMGEGVDEMTRLENIGALPEDILSGLEALSDEELAIVMEQNPELADLIR